MKRLSRQQVAALVAEDLPEGAVVNLGIGMPTMVTDQLDPSRAVQLHSENGIVGMRLLTDEERPDIDLINASKQAISLNDGAAIFDHVYSFSIMRGGHLDITVMGAFEVSASGDLANWALAPDDPLPAVGGAMDLAAGGGNVWIMMDSMTRTGESRLKAECTLPVTALGVVKRVYTDIGVFDIEDGAFVPIGLVAGLETGDLEDWLGGPFNCREQPRILNP